MSDELPKKVKNFICGLCDDKLSSKHCLKMHTLSCHTNRNSVQPHIIVFEDDNPEISITLGFDDNYNCPCCSYIGQSESEVDNHLANQCLNYDKYVEYLKEVDNKNSKFNCQSCKYKSKSKALYRKHLKKHGHFKEIQVFSCPDCHYTTSRRSLITSHILTHTRVKKYKCDQCSYSAIRSDYLKKHLVTHTKDYRPYKCNFCCYTARRSDHLKKHLILHSQYPSIKCPDCDYRCYQRTELKIHLKTHTHATLFKCTTCDFESHEKEAMMLHVADHSQFSAFVCHNISDTFECDKCKLTFENNEDMSNHQCADTLSFENSEVASDNQTVDKCTLSFENSEDASDHQSVGNCKRAFENSENMSDQQCVDKSNILSCDHCHYETYNDKDFITHTITHSCNENSNVEICHSQITECGEDIILDEAESTAMMSNYIVEMPDTITFLTDSKITGNDLVISTFPIEDLAITKGELSELSQNEQNIILDIEYKI